MVPQTCTLTYLVLLAIFPILLFFTLESSIIDSVGFVYSFICAGPVCTFIQIASLTVYALMNIGMIKHGATKTVYVPLHNLNDAF